MAMVRAEWLHRLVNHAQHIDGALAPTIAMPTLKEIEQRLARALPPSTPLEELLLRSVAAKSYLEALTVRRGAGIARRVGHRPESLNRLFHHAFGQSIPEYLVSVRVLEAITRLRANADKIESIAQAVGYRSKRAFYRAVRTHIGLTPGQLRAGARASTGPSP